MTGLTTVSLVNWGRGPGASGIWLAFLVRTPGGRLS